MQQSQFTAVLLAMLFALTALPVQADHADLARPLVESYQSEIEDADQTDMGYEILHGTVAAQVDSILHDVDEFEPPIPSLLNGIVAQFAFPGNQFIQGQGTPFLHDGAEISLHFFANDEVDGWTEVNAPVDLELGWNGDDEKFSAPTISTNGVVNVAGFTIDDAPDAEGPATLVATFNDGARDHILAFSLLANALLAADLHDLSDAVDTAELATPILYAGDLSGAPTHRGPDIYLGNPFVESGIPAPQTDGRTLTIHSPDFKSTIATIAGSHVVQWTEDYLDSYTFEIQVAEYDPAQGRQEPVVTDGFAFELQFAPCISACGEEHELPLPLSNFVLHGTVGGSGDGWVSSTSTEGAFSVTIEGDLLRESVSKGDVFVPWAKVVAHDEFSGYHSLVANQLDFHDPAVDLFSIPTPIIFGDPTVPDLPVAGIVFSEAGPLYVDEDGRELVATITNDLGAPLDYFLFEPEDGTSSIDVSCLPCVQIPEDPGFQIPPVPPGSSLSITLTLTGKTNHYDEVAENWIATALTTAEPEHSVEGNIALQGSGVGALFMRADSTDSFAHVNEHIKIEGVVYEAEGNKPTIHLELYEGAVEDGARISHAYTNNGNFAFFVTSNTAKDQTYVVRAYEKYDNTARGFVAIDPAVTVSLNQVWTELVAADFKTVDAAVPRGSPNQVSVQFAWEHDPTVPISGLLTEGDNGILINAAYNSQGSADWVVPDSADPITLTAEDGVEDSGEPGTYLFSMTEAEAVSLDLTLSGSINNYDAGENDQPDTFAIPSTSGATAVWTAPVLELGFENLGSVEDVSPTFVNLGDTVQVTVNAGWSANFDQLAVSPDADSGREPADGTATVYIEETNGDLTLLSGVGTSGVVTTDDGATTFNLINDEDNLDLGPGVYTFHVLPTSFAIPGGSTPWAFDDEGKANILDARDAELGQSFTITWTTVEVSYKASSVAGSVLADLYNAKEQALVSATPNGDEGDSSRWWMSLDDTNDEISFIVEAKFSHDGSTVPDGAIIDVLVDGVPLQQDLIISGGEALVTLDSSVHDHAVIRPVGVVVSVVESPEPNTAGKIEEPSDGDFSMEMLWTKLNLEMTVNDSLVDLAGSVTFTPIARWAHLDGEETEPQIAKSLGGATFFTLVDAPADVASADEVGDVSGTDVVGLSIIGGNELTDTIEVARGCDDVVCGVGSSQDFDEAGYHKFTPALATTPHGIVTEVVHALDVLWTGAVIDLSSDRITTEVGEDIEVYAHAFFAHDTDSTGAALADRTFPSDIDGTFGIVNGQVQERLTITSTDPATDVFTSSDPAHLKIEFRQFGESDAGDGSLVSIHSGEELERVWLELTVEGTHAGALTDGLYAVRAEEVDVDFTAVVEDGGTPVTVDANYPGYSFATTDVNPIANIPNEVHAATPVAGVGATTFSLHKVTGTDPEVETDLGLVADWDSVAQAWNILIPETQYTTPQDVLLRLKSSLQVTDETTIGDSDDAAVTYTAIVLEFVEATSDSGDFVGDVRWTNFDDALTYTVSAGWAHDTSDPKVAVSDVTIRLTEDDGAGTYATRFDAAVQNGDGTYSFTVDTSATVEEFMDHIVVTVAPDPNDIDGNDVWDYSTQLESNDLTFVTGGAGHMEQGFVFTRPAYNVAIADGDNVANINEGVEVTLNAFWAHNELLDIAQSTIWNFDIDGQQTLVTDANTGSGTVQIGSSVVALHDLLPTYNPTESAPNSITAAPEAENVPSVAWTRIEVVLGAPTGRDLSNQNDVFAYTGPFTDPSGSENNYLFPVGTVVTQPATFQYSLDGGQTYEPANGARVQILGQMLTTDVNGVAQASFYGNSEQWFSVGARGISMNIDGKSINSSSDASHYVGFSSDGTNPS